MTRITCLGLGGMGAGMATALAQAGLAPVVHNRSADRTAAFAERGLRVARTPLDAVADADIVVVSLAELSAVEEQLFGPAGALPGLRRGALVVDTSTVSPQASRNLTQRLAQYGVDRIEACLIGNPAQARDGELRVLAGGQDHLVDRAAPVLDVIARRVDRVGGIGQASMLKVLFNALLGCQVASLAEAVALGRANGLAPEMVLGAITGSGFSSAVMDFRADVMRRAEWHPAAFRSRLMAKDLRLATDAADVAGLDLSVITKAGQVYDHEVDAGRGDLDAAAVLLHFEGHLTATGAPA